MDLIRLLDRNELPRDGGNDVEEQLRSMFGAYLSDVQALTNTAHVNPATTDALGNRLLLALQRWLDGDPYTAIEEFDAAMASVSKQIAVLVSSQLNTTGPMFRIRVRDLSDRTQAADLFHIPFESRDRVATQRYSFPGLPCLYLGRSVYVCWEECGRPDLSRLWLSKFCVASDQHVRVLDFGYRPAFVAAMLNANSASQTHRDYAAAYAALWPLIAACSLRRRQNASRGFVVEYVIPQMLLRWILKQRSENAAAIDGIRYFSTHILDYNVEIAGINYVFPAQERARTGVCSVLKQKFHMTHPVNWQIANAGTSAPHTPAYNQVNFELTPGWREDYRFTVFSRTEGFMDGLGLQALP